MNIISKNNIYLHDIIKKGCQLLNKANIDNAKQEIYWFIKDQLSISSEKQILENIILNKFQINIIENFLKRRIAGEPYQYIINKGSFYGYDFFVNKHTLIPRPETELIIEVVKKRGLYDSCLDVGTGSGNIAITLVKEKLVKKVDAIILSKDESLADYFESLTELSGLPLLSCKWILSEVLRVLKDEKIRIDGCPVSIEQLSMLLKILNDNKITAVNAKSVFNIMIESEEPPSKIIEREGFALDQDMDSIESIVQEILEKNPNEVGRFKNGESKLMGFFMGLVMRETKGKADPASITKIIAKLLKK